MVLAANAVLWNLFMIGGFFLDGFATAAETLCGQAVGARDEAGFRRAARLSLLWCLAFGGAIAGGFLVVGHAFIDAVTTSPEVREMARLYLLPAALAPLLAALPFAFDGIFIGATWTGDAQPDDRRERALRGRALSPRTNSASAMAACGCRS